LNKSTSSPDQNLSPDAPIQVPLGHGVYAIIDAEDAPIVVQHRWGKLKVGNKYYAVSWSHDADRKTVNTLLHRLLMNPPEGMDVDHRNGDSLDCRRENMRICTEQENVFNRPKRDGSKNPYIGVYRQIKSPNRWYAKIMNDGKTIHLGGYDTPEDAARAYDAKARELRGEFAYLNFPDEEAA
jgi:AP2 domain.